MKSYHINKQTKTYTDKTVGLAEDYHHIGNFNSLEQFQTRLELSTSILCESNDAIISKMGMSMQLNVPIFGEVKETEEVEVMVWLWCDQTQKRIELDFQLRQSLLS